MFIQPLPSGQPPRTRHRDGSRQRCLTLPSGTKQPYGVGPIHLPVERLPRRSATPQKPLRADDPVTHVARLDPRRVTASCWRVRGGIETPGGRYSSPRPHRLSSSVTRSSGRIGRPRRTGAAPVLVGVDLANASRSPVRGPIQANGVGRGPQHDARGRTSQDGRANAVAVVPQFGVQLPGPGRWSRIKVRSSVFCPSPGVWVGARLSPSGTASGRTAPACATGGTRTARASPPARPGPSACRASSPAAASTPLPPGPTGSSGTRPH